ncbi:hypothetical protein LEN26_017857 [Aphanomyces euteiches]|nr:hypothetical protein LEN26_017857 [Aphanomyces euteiches]
MVTTCVNVTKNVYRDMLIKNVLPRIMDVLPPSTNRKRIILQHDNAPAHVPWNDVEIMAVFNELTSIGSDFSIAPQPPNSPDTNVLDLGFFASIQSLQYKHVPRSVDELVSCVMLEFDKYSMAKLSKIWQSLQLVLLEIVKAKGGNDFKLPHASKDRNARCGKMLDNAVCDKDAYQEAIEHLNSEDALSMEAALKKEVDELRAENELIDLLEGAALNDPDVDDNQLDALCLAAGLHILVM